MARGYRVMYPLVNDDLFQWRYRLMRAVYDTTPMLLGLQREIDVEFDALRTLTNRRFDALIFQLSLSVNNAYHRMHELEQQRCRYSSTDRV